jgi:hypothetical protein
MNAAAPSETERRRLRFRLDLIEILQEEQARRGPPRPGPTMDESELRGYWREVTAIRSHATIRAVSAWEEE